MKDETLQTLVNLLGEGFLRELLGKEKTLKQLRAEARLRCFNNISKLKKAQLKNLLSKPQHLDQLRKKSIGESKETWNQKCHKVQKDTTHQRN